MSNNELLAITLVVKEKETVCGAIEAGAEVTLRLRVPRRMAALRVNAVLAPDEVREDGAYADTVRILYPGNHADVADPMESDGENKPAKSRLNFAWNGLSEGYDIYEAKWKSELCALYYLRLEVVTAKGSRFAEKQITVYRSGASVPDWMTDGVMYHIFPDRFAKSEKHKLPVKPYAEINPDWNGGTPKFAKKPGDPLDNNEFFGGSLYGVIEKLDYIESLGVNIIYLNPIFEAYSNHKYDTADYTRVDEMFGGDDALSALISECDKRGIRIILDGVFNHTGSDSVYFNAEGRYGRGGAAKDPGSPYRDWYLFKNYPNSYECWWGVKILPTLNKQSRSLRDFISGENGVIRRWLRKGISGWRLDVVDELPDSMVAEIRAAAVAEREDAILLGEVWEDASDKIAYEQRRKYFQGYELSSVMNYPFRTAIIDYVMSGDARRIARDTRRQYEHYPEHISLAQMNLLGTHDTERILCMLSGADASGVENAGLARLALNGEQRAAAVRNLKLAAALLYALPGVPCIYYGDEVGMEGWRDPFNRRPFPWGRENTEILEFYRVLGALRRSERDLRRGDFKVVCCDGGVFGFRRGGLTVIANRGEHAFSVKYEKPFVDLISGMKAGRCVDGRYEMYVIPGTVVYIKRSEL
ncbi:MAG: glycoside hydrolase family 13 protein [Clostridia bacterium]|nr:glycoside hydrolase family 13 protein [Clostridia bacterium]